MLTGAAALDEDFQTTHLHSSIYLTLIMDVKRYPFTDFVTVTPIQSRKSKTGKELETFRSGRLWLPTGARGVFGGQV
jgi:hypothetical protein